MSPMDEATAGRKIFKAYNRKTGCYIPTSIKVAKLMTAVCSIPHSQVSVMTSAPAR